MGKCKRLKTLMLVVLNFVYKRNTALAITVLGLLRLDRCKVMGVNCREQLT